MDAALLILHAPDDEVVAIENAARLYTAARHPKSFIALPGAGHLLLGAADGDYVGSVLAAWAERYLPPAVEAPEEADRPTHVTVTTSNDGFRTDIGVRAHTLIADEPVSVGGTDAGPTPYDLLVAALGACTTMTLQLYARRKQWPLERAIARLQHAKRYPQDQANCENDPVKLDQIDRELEFVGPLSDEQRERLAEIADRCPVHRSLEPSMTIVTTVRGAAE